MKSKKICLLITAVLFLASASGCSSSNGGKSSETATTSSTTSSAVKTTPAKDTPQYEGYNLLWNDEFDANKLDMNTWNYEPHEPGWTNSELQEYTESEENVFLRDGNLIIKALKTKDSNGEDYYTSGKVTCQNKKDFTYGKVVVSAKVPEGQGLWPAIWMMPQDEEFYGQWPKCGEIDIMEVLGNNTNTAYGTIHYGEPHAEQQGVYTLEDGTFASDFHEYSVEWEPGEIVLRFKPFIIGLFSGFNLLSINNIFFTGLFQTFFSKC